MGDPRGAALLVPPGGLRVPRDGVPACEERQEHHAKEPHGRVLRRTRLLRRRLGPRPRRRNHGRQGRTRRQYLPRRRPVHAPLPPPHRILWLSPLVLQLRLRSDDRDDRVWCRRREDPIPGVLYLRDAVDGDRVPDLQPLDLVSGRVFVPGGCRGLCRWRRGPRVVWSGGVDGGFGLRSSGRRLRRRQVRAAQAPRYDVDDARAVYFLVRVHSLQRRVRAFLVRLRVGESDGADRRHHDPRRLLRGRRLLAVGPLRERVPGPRIRHPRGPRRYDRCVLLLRRGRRLGDLLDHLAPVGDVLLGMPGPRREGRHRRSPHGGVPPLRPGHRRHARRRLLRDAALHRRRLPQRLRHLPRPLRRPRRPHLHPRRRRRRRRRLHLLQAPEKRRLPGLQRHLLRRQRHAARMAARRLRPLHRLGRRRLRPHLLPHEVPRHPPRRRRRRTPGTRRPTPRRTRLRVAPRRPAHRRQGRRNDRRQRNRRRQN
mmetsp:Transcript_21533/g.69333  ORF Transcript_21533/g.69333 Transcript_21533/m.69333 type:complete len:482 (-) Transcript_21533:361-1806(-)